MCACGWDLVVLAVVLAGLLVVYGEINRRSADIKPQGSSARHRHGEPVAALRERHGADALPYYPNPPSGNGS